MARSVCAAFGGCYSARTSWFPCVLLCVLLGLISLPCVGRLCGTTCGGGAGGPKCWNLGPTHAPISVPKHFICSPVALLQWCAADVGAQLSPACTQALISC